MTSNNPKQQLVRYSYGERKGYFHIWPTLKGKWGWSVSGASGEEATPEKAIRTARETILNSQLAKSIR